MKAKVKERLQGAGLVLFVLLLTAAGNVMADEVPEEESE